MFIVVFSSATLSGYCGPFDFKLPKFPQGEKLPFHWEDCGKKDRVIKILEGDVQPQPIVMYLDSTLNLSGVVEIAKDLDPKTDELEVKITRINTVVGRVNIPVFYEKKTGCEFIKDSKFKDILCSLMVAAGLQCSCETKVKVGKYTIKNSNTIFDLDKLPFLLKEGITRYGSGNWMGELWGYRENQQLGCGKVVSHTEFRKKHIKDEKKDKEEEED